MNKFLFFFAEWIKPSLGRDIYGKDFSCTPLPNLMGGKLITEIVMGLMVIMEIVLV